MRKKELAERLAKQTQQSEGAAADQLDEAIYRVLKNLRHPESPKPSALQRLLEEANRTPGEKRRQAKS
jgi:hypothetical protein